MANWDTSILKWVSERFTGLCLGALNSLSQKKRSDLELTANILPNKFLSKLKELLPKFKAKDIQKLFPNALIFTKDESKRVLGVNDYSNVDFYWFSFTVYQRYDTQPQKADTLIPIYHGVFLFAENTTKSIVAAELIDSTHHFWFSLPPNNIDNISADIVGVFCDKELIPRLKAFSSTQNTDYRAFAVGCTIKHDTNTQCIMICSPSNTI